MRPPPSHPTHSPATIVPSTTSSSPDIPPKPIGALTNHITSHSTPSQSASPPLCFPRNSQSQSPDLGIWPGDGTLNRYIHDYLCKRGFANTAEKLVEESGMDKSAGWGTNSFFNVPQGLLYEWWTIFWEVFLSTSGKSGHAEATLYSQIVRASRSDSVKPSPAAQISSAGLIKLSAAGRPPDPTANPDSDIVTTSPSTSTNTCSNNTPNINRPPGPPRSDSINVTHGPASRARRNVPNSPNPTGVLANGASMSSQTSRLRTTSENNLTSSQQAPAPATSTSQLSIQPQQHALHPSQQYQLMQLQRQQQQAQQQHQQSLQMNLSSANVQSQRPGNSLIMAPPPHPSSLQPRPNNEAEKDSFMTHQAMHKLGFYGRDISTLTPQEKERLMAEFAILAQNQRAHQVNHVLAQARSTSFSPLPDPRVLPSHPSMYRDIHQLPLQQQHERQLGVVRASQLQQPTQTPMNPPQASSSNPPGRPQSQNSLAPTANSQPFNGSQNRKKRPLTPGQTSHESTSPVALPDYNGPSPTSRKRNKTVEAPSPGPSPRVRVSSGMSVNGTSMDTQRAMEILQGIPNRSESQPGHEGGSNSSGGQQHPEQNFYGGSNPKTNGDQPKMNFSSIPTPASTPNGSQHVNHSHSNSLSAEPNNPSTSRASATQLGLTGGTSSNANPNPLSVNSSPALSSNPMNGFGGLSFNQHQIQPRAPISDPSNLTSAAGLDFRTMSGLFGVPDTSGLNHNHNHSGGEKESGSQSNTAGGGGAIDLGINDTFDLAEFLKEAAVWPSMP